MPVPLPAPAAPAEPAPETAAAVPVVPQTAPPPVPVPVAPPAAPTPVARPTTPVPVASPSAPRTEAVDSNSVPASASRDAALAEQTLPRAGAPDAGVRLGHDVATPPAQPSSAPRLNLDLVRPRGGEISRQTAPGVLELLPHPPERKSKLAEDIEKAAKPDCRKAYSGLGLLAVVPLAIDAVKDSGCRW